MSRQPCPLYWTCESVRQGSCSRTSWTSAIACASAHRCRQIAIVTDLTPALRKELTPIRIIVASGSLVDANSALNPAPTTSCAKGDWMVRSWPDLPKEGCLGVMLAQ